MRAKRLRGVRAPWRASESRSLHRGCAVRRGGRPASYGEEQRERVLALAAEGRSQRQIAELVFGDGRCRGRVERILRTLPRRPVASALPSEDSEPDFEAMLASGGEFAAAVELVSRDERSLLSRDTAPALAEIERLLRVRRQLAAIAAVERAKRLTRGGRSSETSPDPRGT
jgi:hypothetical protein